ncbi:hypothetical protein M5K25_026633 [Dendrobium thyrsiflorum]|uniref:Uncharacterized protein n=1 Tax=Dendrobium thyrsiflorum TaxID=117978 RepID=A0ABD0TXZ7_DENTH
MRTYRRARRACWKTSRSRRRSSKESDTDVLPIEVCRVISVVPSMPVSEKHVKKEAPESCMMVLPMDCSSEEDLYFPEEDESDPDIASQMENVNLGIDFESLDESPDVMMVDSEENVSSNKSEPEVTAQVQLRSAVIGLSSDFYPTLDLRPPSDFYPSSDFHSTSTRRWTYARCQTSARGWTFVGLIPDTVLSPVFGHLPVTELSPVVGLLLVVGLSSDFYLTLYLTPDVLLDHYSAQLPEVSYNKE